MKNFLPHKIIYYQTSDDREHHLIDIACENHHQSERTYNEHKNSSRRLRWGKNYVIFLRSSKMCSWNRSYYVDYILLMKWYKEERLFPLRWTAGSINIVRLRFHEMNDKLNWCARFSSWIYENQMNVIIL